MRLIKRLSLMLCGLILTVSFAQIPARSQTTQPTPSETSAGMPKTQATPCADLENAKDKQICELASALNKTLADKRAALASAEANLDALTAAQINSKDKDVLIANEKKVIEDLKNVIDQYVRIVEVMQKHPPKKCYVVIFHC